MTIVLRDEYLRADAEAGARYPSVVFQRYVGGGGLIYDGEKVTSVGVN